MVDFVPALLLVFGLVAAAKPEWVAALDRRQKATGTTRRPDEVEMSETYYAVVRIAGIGFVLFGLVFVLRSW
jgi:preprotein translocase subunit Sss1